MRRYILPLLVVVLPVVFISPTTAQQSGPGTGLRGSAALYDNAEAPRVAKVEETDRRRTRAYPEQPPTIPHQIDGYQLDRNSNQCLSCHARSRTEESGAPMISITHFMDRDGQPLATVSPRRYFCNQCHVVQTVVPAPIENRFVDIDTLLTVERAGAHSGQSD